MDFGKEFKKYATQHAGINSMYVEHAIPITKTVRKMLHEGNSEIE